MLAAYVDGDVEAFGELVRRHRDLLWRVARRITRDPDEAEDALHDAFVRAFRRAGTWNQRSSPVAWLSRVVANCALDVVLRRRPYAMLTAEMGHSGSEPSASADPTDLRASLEVALGELEPNQRAAFFLVALRDYTHLEAAELLGVEVGTSKVWLHRARAHLARLLVDEVGDEEGRRG